MQVSDLSVKSVATGDFSFKGELSGFGQQPQVKNMKYQTEIRDVTSFLDKFDIKPGNVDWQELKRFSASGVVTGDFDRVATKSVVQLGNIDAAYQGEITYRDNIYYLNGKTEVKAPDFVGMLNRFAINYKPNYPLGLFKMSAAVKTSGKLAIFSNLDMSIGGNNFTGNLIYQEKDGRNQVKANLNVNSFEFEKFLYNAQQKENKNDFRNSPQSATFIVRPRLSQQLLNYDWLKNWDLNATFTADRLSFNNIAFTENSGQILLQSGVLKLAKYQGKHSGGDFKGEFSLDIPQGTRLNGKFSVRGYTIGKKSWSGSVYGLTRGVLNSDIEFDTSAFSQETLMTELSGTIKFDIEKVVIKGWNFGKIEADLVNREVSDGFAVMVRDALGQGDALFDTMSGEVRLTQGQYAVSGGYIEGSNINIDFTADGNLRSWTNNAVFHVSFLDAKVPGFDFSYSGSINTPMLDVDVSKVTKVFDEHWAKKEKEAKEQEQARVEKYRTLMDAEQAKAQNTAKTLDELVSDFDEFSKLATDKSTQEQYQTIDKNIDAVYALLEEIYAKNNMTGIDDGVIARLQEQNKKAEDEVRKIVAEFERVHLKDVKLRISESYNVVFESYNKAEKLSSDSLDKMGAFEKRLAAINTSFYPGKDQKILSWQRRIDESLAAIDDINGEVAKDNISLQNLKDVVQLEFYFKKFDNSRQDALSELEKMEKAVADMEDYTEAKVSADERAYVKWLHEREIKRKMEENTGQISSGGKTVMVGRDLDDIQRAEAAVKDQKVRVLDFSGESDENVGGGGVRRGNYGGSESGGIIVKQ